MRYTVLFSLLCFGILVVLAGCSGANAAPASITDLDNRPHCDVWRGIEAWGADSSSLSTKEGWDTRVSLTEQLVTAAPPQFASNAAVYLQIVYDRVDLLSAYDYVTVQQLPPDVRQSFIQAHFADQQIANEFTNFLSSECKGPSDA